MDVATLHAEPQPRRLSDLTTPALLLDGGRMDRNIARARRQAAALGVSFRPHVKTAKSAEIARRLCGGGFGPITVSTLAEARHMHAAGFTDILYAIALAPAKLPQVEALRAAGADLIVIVDSVAAAEAVAAASRAGGDVIPALIEIDCDGVRAGVKPYNSALIVAIAAALADGGEVAGVMTHCGASYGARDEADMDAFAEQERSAVVLAADTLRSAGILPRIVSVGSTPTFLGAHHMTGITEARAGVLTFFDLVMAGVGACAIDDIALSVLANVTGIQQARGRYLVDAGWMAMSRDLGTARQPIDQGYGVVCDAQGRPFPDLVMVDASQEHGVLALRNGSTASLPLLAIGDLVRILPNHACATAAQHHRYHLVEGTGDAVLGEIARFGGW